MPPDTHSLLDAENIRHLLAEWFAGAGRDLPWRRFPEPYSVLVSEFMLQQTQVSTVIPYFERWMQRLPSLRHLAEASEETLLGLWQGLGYYSRARNLQKTAREVFARFGGVLPEDPSQLRSLPGIGPYSADAIAAFAFDRPAPAVDANIARVLARLTHMETPVDSKAGALHIQRIATALLPEQGGGRLHTSALMELGALVCLPKKPKCLLCPLKTHCRAPQPELLPRKSPRKPTLFIEERAAWCVQEDKVLLEQQTGRRSRGLWKLPPLTSVPEDEPLFRTVYPFTHHRVTLFVHAAPPPSSAGASQRWFALATVLEEAALPAGHRRALGFLVEKSSTAHSFPDRSLPNWPA